MKACCRAIIAFTIVLFGCGGGHGEAPKEDAPEQVSPLHSTTFRVRGSIDAPVNEDVGWAALAGEATVVTANQPFRIRMEVEAPAGTEDSLPTSFTLQARRNGGTWQTLSLRDFPYPDEISTPRVSLVRLVEWGTGVPTDDLLTASELLFTPGEGVSDTLRMDAEDEALESDNAAAPWPDVSQLTAEGASRVEASVHGEWEWPVVIRRWADGAVTNEDGDTFDFRMLDGAGHPVAGAGTARVTFRIPENLLGGTFAETPGVLGPWQGEDGTLYFPMEPAETYNMLMMVASTDHGASWTEVDGANRPITDDLEGFATAWHDGVIYLLHQISRATYLHAFDTRTKPTKTTGGPSAAGVASGRWVIRDELVSEHSKPPVQVASLIARSDGSLVAVYGDSLGLRSRIRNPEGGWEPEGTVEVADGALASGVMTVGLADDVIHVAYTATSADWTARSVQNRTLTPLGGLTDATRLGEGLGTAEEEIGALLPLGWVPASNAVVVAWRHADGTLWERRILADGSVSDPIRITTRPVVQSAADSDQVGADLVVHDDVVHVVFIDEETRDLWHTSSPAPRSWTPARPVVEGIDAQWVRGRVVQDASGAAVYGLVYDAGSNGGSGMNRYAVISLDGSGM
jgi:hypothetical protein